jgi:hypothetical protein
MTGSLTAFSLLFIVCLLPSATDIMDKQLNDLRRSRWERAFADGNNVESHKDTNLRATIVIEHIIQASDVSHTMQHWHVYRKWNGRLFEEVYQAYREGRMDKDPSEGWYKGELGFFDFYIVSYQCQFQDQALSSHPTDSL